MNDTEHAAAHLWYRDRDSRNGVAIGTAEGEFTVIPGTENAGSTSTWSPDSRQIAFIVRGSGPDAHKDSELITYDVATARTTLLAQEVSDAFWVSWSPDGEWLLLDDWTRHRRLFVAVDGSEQIGYRRLGHFPRWCCPSSPPIDVPIPVC